jgi:hypothetical protein
MPPDVQVSIHRNYFIMVVLQQFTQLIDRSRIYSYLPIKQMKGIEKFQLSDSQIFCRSEDGEIDCWKVYNLFTSATKSSHFDTFLDRNAGSLIFISELIHHQRSSTKSWYLS